MSDPTRPTAKTVELIDAHVSPPAMGQTVLGLTIGGILVQAAWQSHSISTFDAWMPFPKVPEAVRKRQLARFQHDILQES
ncbi:hypothetical protein ACO0LM_11985 [Undibacterium sp. Di26W]|uniref:hypothetical protein n=1 Tax=Undibacterium sp. Di26W TaxID=3413035 RepID=UPI003BF16DFD